MSARRISDAVSDCSAAQCLEAALLSGRLAHAYLLVGRDEEAKLALASALAKAGNCEGDHGPAEFCGLCSSCRQVDAGGSANMRVFGDSRILKIDTVDQFIAYASVKTASGCLKVSVFRGVDFFTDVAADRVLKTIEEPVPGNVFLLLSQNSRRVLPTIRSRVQIMKVERESQVSVDSRPTAPATDEDTSLEVLLEFARANVGLSETVSRLLKMSSQAGLRENATAGLVTIALFMNSVLRARGKVAPSTEVSLSTEPELARVNFVLDESKVGSFLDHLGKRLKHVEQNVNPELVLTNALLELRRITTHE